MVGATTDKYSLHIRRSEMSEDKTVCMMHGGHARRGGKGNLAPSFKNPVPLELLASSSLWQPFQNRRLLKVSILALPSSEASSSWPQQERATTNGAFALCFEPKGSGFLL